MVKPACCETWGSDCPAHGDLYLEKPGVIKKSKPKHKVDVVLYAGLAMSFIAIVWWFIPKGQSSHSSSSSLPVSSPSSSSSADVIGDSSGSGLGKWMPMDAFRESLLNGDIHFGSDKFRVMLFDSKVNTSAQRCALTGGVVASTEVHVKVAQRGTNRAVYFADPQPDFGPGTVAREALLCDETTDRSVVHYIFNDEITVMPNSHLIISDTIDNPILNLD